MILNRFLKGLLHGQGQLALASARQELQGRQRSYGSYNRVVPGLLHYLHHRPRCNNHRPVLRIEKRPFVGGRAVVIPKIQISVVLLQLEYRFRPAIRVPSRAISQLHARGPEIKKVHLISSPLQVPNQIQVPARPASVASKPKSACCLASASISPSIALAAAIAALYGACDEKSVRDNTGIYKIRTVRIVCQELPRKRCLARSIQMAHHLYPLQQINRHTCEQQQTFTFALLNFYTLPRGTSDV
jgi:hypothetical protein